MKNELDGIKFGTLIINHVKGRTQYYEANKDGRHGITTNRKRVEELARRRYLKKKLNILRKEQKLTKKYAKKLYKELLPDGVNPIDKVINGFVKTDLELARITLSRKQYNWRDHQSENPMFREDLKYITTRGIAMRTKSEFITGEIMDEYDIPYRYEPAVEVDVTALCDFRKGIYPDYSYQRSGRVYKKYYPDFVILLADGSFIIWEHLGMANDKKYREDNKDKLFAYLSSVGIEHLIFTYEEDVNKPERIHEIIRTRVLPYL